MAATTRFAPLVAMVVAFAAGAAAAPASAAPPVRERVDLASGAQLRIDGSEPAGRLGEFVDGAGDVNGDGRADMIFGAYRPRTAHVVFGGARGVVDGAAPAGAGFAIRLEGSNYGPSHVSGAGDVNGDGLSDVIVGAHGEDHNGRPGSGSAYVVFGKRSTTTVDVATLGAQGFRIDGEHAGGALGWRVDAAGDVNLDGLADVAVSAPFAPSTLVAEGSVYVVFGRAASEPVDVASLGTGGYRIDGGSGSEGAGAGIAGAGDFNGDDRPDLLVGLESHSSNIRTYVVFGKSSSAGVDLSLLGPAGVQIRHPDRAFSNGLLAGAGDVNGDGLGDVLIGGDDSRPTYAVLGRRSGDPIELAALGTGGFTIAGGPPSRPQPGSDHDDSERPVAGAGDVDRDGLADVMVAIPRADGTGGAGAGRTYVVFGSSAPGPVQLDRLGSAGFEIHGARTHDNAGTTIASAGDVDRDGHADLLVGAPFADNNERKQSGSAYLVRGGPCCRPPRPLPGSPTRTAPLWDEAHLRVAGEGIGRTVDSAGDVNGDRRADVVLVGGGSPPSWAHPRSAFVIFGTATGAGVELPALGPAGFRIDAPSGGFVTDATGVGDMNGDRRGDLLIGVSTRFDLRGPESAYVVFGKSTSEAVDLGALGGGGFRILGGEAFATRGVWVAGVGDVNRDRRPDVAVGFPSTTEDERDAVAYVVFGKASTGTVDLAALGSGGYPIAAGASTDGGGPRVHEAGDVNGDRRADVLVSTYYDAENPFESGATYVVFGKSSSDPVDVHSLGFGGFRIEGPPLDGEFTASADGAGDVNRDGRGDVVVTYPYATNYLRDTGGWTYVVFGKRSGAPVRLAALGSRGFRISGDPLVSIPFAAAGAGDFNRDRKADVVLGGQSTACVVFGRRSTATLDLGRLGRQGTCFDGHRSSEAGTTVAGAGDFNRDGYADVVVGAQYEGAFEPWPGAAYVVLGRRIR